MCDIGQSEGGAEVAQMRAELRDVKAEVARLSALVEAGRGLKTDDVTSDTADLAERARVSDPSEKLQSDLDAAIAAGRSSFAISPGVYRPQRDLFVNNAADLRIAPSGEPGSAVFLFRCNWGVVLRSCTNVSIQDLIVDYDPPCFSQGVVTASGNGLVTYTLDEGFPAPVGESAVSDSRFAQAPIVKVRTMPPRIPVRMPCSLSGLVAHPR